MVITNLEIFFRKSYAVLKDSKHVVFGESIFHDVYSDTRNEFLNFGVTCGKYKRDLGVDIKGMLDADSFRTISDTYFKRHVIVHNASVIDKEFISQTNCDAELFKQRLPISIRDVMVVIEKADRPIQSLNIALEMAILGLIENRFTISPKAATETK